MKWELQEHLPRVIVGKTEEGNGCQSSGLGTRKALRRQQLLATVLTSTSFSAHQGPGASWQVAGGGWRSGLSAGFTSKNGVFEGGRSGPGAPEPETPIQPLASFSQDTVA